MELFKLLLLGPNKDLPQANVAAGVPVGLAVLYDLS